MNPAIKHIAWVAATLSLGCGNSSMDSLDPGTGATNGFGGTGGAFTTGGAGGDAGTGGSPTHITDNCDDGVDCYCDRVHDPEDALYNPGVIFCEDFEDPRLNDGDDSVPGVADSGDGWADKYPGQVDGCLDGSQPRGQGLKDEGAEGTNAWSCVNVVQEGACETGDDCVFDGDNALAHRAIPGKKNGITGRASFSGGYTNDFSVTMAIKYTDNFVLPKDGGGVANKTNEFGEARTCILGCSVSNVSSDTPFGATLKAFRLPDGPHPGPGGTVHQGQFNYQDGGWRFGPDNEDYDFHRDWGLGNWACFQMQWTGYGTSNASGTYWINGQQVFHASDLDLFDLPRDGGGRGINQFEWNNYYNGGYSGSTIASRLEDNIVITNGTPVSCEAIGFAF